MTEFNVGSPKSGLFRRVVGPPVGLGRRELAQGPSGAVSRADRPQPVSLDAQKQWRAALFTNGAATAAAACRRRPPQLQTALGPFYHQGRPQDLPLQWHRAGWQVGAAHSAPRPQVGAHQDLDAVGDARVASSSL